MSSNIIEVSESAVNLQNSYKIMVVATSSSLTNEEFIVDSVDGNKIKVTTASK